MSIPMAVRLMQRYKELPILEIYVETKKAKEAGIALFAALERILV